MSFRKTLVILLVLFAGQLSAQKKYNSLLWEISGKGLKKPSYLYGTMHVSNKLAFHLGDPFYKAISESDVVATELNADTWFSDFITSDDYKVSIQAATAQNDESNDVGFGLYNTRKTLIKTILQQDLSAINDLMYRLSSTGANAEEATYLDMYIYKTGKKLKKKIAGVETYTAMMAALTESTKPEKDAEESEVAINPKDKASTWLVNEQIEDAYRHADLDQLDSLTKLSMTKREAEYILYRRNRIMTDFIDSVTRSQRLFIGVGSAHLPGEKGIIELLRKKGYTVKPLDMGERDALQRSSIDSMIYDQPMSTFVSSDSFYSVMVPGTMLNMLATSSVSYQTSVDMGNGAYYTVARILSASFLKGESEAHVLQSIDSMFYETVPGDIVTKKEIEISGYKGFDITNRTRRGDLQRFQLLVTPDEVLVFRLAGTDNFASSALADQFFRSIHLKPRRTSDWQTFVSPDSSFSVTAPANMFEYYTKDLDNLDNRVVALASDAKTDNRFFVLKHSYDAVRYIEQDSFDLEGILTSFYKDAKYKRVSSKYFRKAGRNIITATYTTPEKRNVKVYAVIRQLDYVVMGMYYDKDSSQADKFFESFKVRNRPYNVPFTWYKDTTLRCKVKLPYVPKESAFREIYSKMKTNQNGQADMHEVTKTFCRPGYDERVTVSFSIYDKYLTLPDTTFYKRVLRTLSENYYQVLSGQKKVAAKDGWQLDVMVSDTGSSQVIHKRFILKNGTRYILQAYVDTVLGESDFIKTFFSSFTPQDTVIGSLPSVAKGQLYLKDLYSADTAQQNKAAFYPKYVQFGKEDAQSYIDAIKTLPKIKDYKDVKTNLILNLAVCDDKRIIDFMKAEYPKYSDTAVYQFSILRALTDMGTPASVAAFKDLIMSEQPLSTDFNLNRIFAPLIDSPELVKDHFNDLYPLASIEEYKPYIIRMMDAMHNKKLLKDDQYKDKIPGLLNEARNEFKRGQADNSNNSNDEKSLLLCYSGLLVPFAHTNTGVRSYLDRILQQGSSDQKIETIALMLKKGEPVADSIMLALATDPAKRIYFYRGLIADSLTAKFPAKYKDGQELCYALARMAMHTGLYGKDAEDNDLDSLVLLDKQPAQLFDKKGVVYLYKIKAASEKFWRLKLVGIQGKPDKLNAFNDLYVQKSYYLDTDKDLKEQFDETLKEILENKIKFSNVYYKNFRDFTQTHRSSTYLN